MLGKLIGEEAIAATPKLWEILTHLLGDRGVGSDAVVRFSAAAALKDCVDVNKVFSKWDVCDIDHLSLF